MYKKVLLIAVLCMLSAGAAASFAADDLSRYTRDGRSVKAYIGNIANESGQAQLNADDFKSSLKNAMINRRAVKFEIAETLQSSDIQVSAVIKKYLYSKTDPITLSPSVGSLLLDAVTTENYVEMTADFTITDTKSGKVVWQNTLMAFIKHSMTPEESIPMIYEKLARTFLWKSFGKPR